MKTNLLTIKSLNRDLILNLDLIKSRILILPISTHRFNYQNQDIGNVRYNEEYKTRKMLYHFNFLNFLLYHLFIIC